VNHIHVSMPPYTHILTTGTGMFVREHSVHAFLERYDDHEFLSSSQMYDLFVGPMRQGDYASDLFFDQTVLREAQRPVVARTHLTRVAVEIDDVIHCKDYTTRMTYADVVQGIDIPNGYVWKVFLCQAMRTSISHQTVNLVAFDSSASMSDTIPCWDGKTFRVLLPLPPANEYVYVRMNTRVLQKWLIFPMDGEETQESVFELKERILESISKYLVRDREYSLDVRYIYRYSDPLDTSMYRVNCHIYHTDQESGLDRVLYHDDFVSRDIDTSGLLSIDDMYTHVFDTHVPGEFRDFFSMQRQTFLAFLHECISMKHVTTYQRFKVTLSTSSEVIVSYYADAEYLEEGTRETSPSHHVSRYLRHPHPIVHFTCQYTKTTHSTIDDIMETLQRLDILVPQMFHGRSCAVQERILKAVSDRTMPFPECVPDERQEVSRSMRLINTSETLYEYQKENIRWMVHQEHAKDGMVGLFATRVTGEPNGPGVFRRLFPETSFSYARDPRDLFTSGGFLCDDVGMGKTRQIIELVRVTSTSSTIATMIIVPPNIIDQWRREIETVWPECNVAIFHGRYKRYVDISSYERTQQYDIVLTTPRMETSIPNYVWERIVIDESHIIRYCSQRHTAKKKWLVTATPYTKMLDQFHWLLGKASLLFYKPSEYDSSYTRWPYDSNPGYKRQYILFQMLMTRKTRDVHALLPSVQTTRTLIPLTSEDRTYYDDTIRHIRGQGTHSNYVSVMHAASTLSSAATLGPRFVCQSQHEHQHRCFEEDRRIDPKDVPHTELCPICITNIGADAVRTSCNHWFCEECLTVCLTTNNGNTRCPMCRGNIPSKSVQRTIQPQHTDENTHDITDWTTYVSGKMKMVIHDIQQHRSLDKSILVFFNHKEQMEYVSAICRDTGIHHMCVHGGMHVERRNRVFSLFQERASEESRVVLTTTKCASAGLTLTSADVILLISPSDDASTEEQIIGRARRIGRPHDQPIEFHVYVSENTIEEDVYRQRQSHRTANVWDITRRILG